MLQLLRTLKYQRQQKLCDTTAHAWMLSYGGGPWHQKKNPGPSWGYSCHSIAEHD